MSINKVSNNIMSPLSGMISSKTKRHMPVNKIEVNSDICAGQSALISILKDQLLMMSKSLDCVIEIEGNMSCGFIDCYANGHHFVRSYLPEGAEY